MRAMRVRTGPSCRAAGQGFTLIEILLATVILMLLAGAMIFSFSALEKGAALDEGVSQFESLLRFERAQAALSGRVVQVSFEEAMDPEGFVLPDKALLRSEPEPLAEPGVWKDIPEAGHYLERLHDLVLVDSLRLLGPDGSELETLGEPEPGAAAEPADTLELLPVIRFFPDGSSDSAEIVLASRNSEDTRRVTLRLTGVTGTVRRSLSDTNLLEAAPEETERRGSMESRSSAPASKAAPVPEPDDSDK